MKDVIQNKVHSNVHKLMEQGKTLAVNSGKPVLISAVSTIPNINLVNYFVAQNNKFAGNRFFWSEPDRRLSFIGLGNVLSIEPVDENNRFVDVEQSWNEILSNSLMESDLPQHTGPLLFGGFSFDPNKESSALWQDFPHSRFVVPQYMVTHSGDNVWLTTNKLVSPHAHEQADLDDVLDFSEFIALESISHATVLEEEFSPSDWMDSVKEASSLIREGRLDKVVLVRQIGLTSEDRFDLGQIIHQLLTEQTDTYVFAVDHGNSCFVGATPERLIEKQGNELRSLALAGSIARGGSDEEDEQLGQFLLNDVKNLREHMLTVQMVKSVMNELCSQVKTPETPILYKLKDIQHLATPISGYARNGTSLLKVVSKLHPTPALGGMPVETAIEEIRRLEPLNRGWYAAPIGWINRQQDGEFVAAIRSALVQNNEAMLFAGCGIMGDSHPLSEYEETTLKFRPMLAALQVVDPQSKGERT